MVQTGQAGGVHRATAAAGHAEAVSLVDQQYGVVRSATAARSANGAASLSTLKTDSVITTACGSLRSASTFGDRVDVVVRDDLDPRSGQPAGVHQRRVDVVVGDQQRARVRRVR